MPCGDVVITLDGLKDAIRALADGTVSVPMPSLIIVPPQLVAGASRFMWLNKMARLGHHGRKAHMKAKKQAKKQESREFYDPT
jgi:hypothetical protein